MFRSIKSRLFIWFILIFSGFFICFSVYIYEEHQVVTMNAVDKLLESKLHFLRGMIEIFKDGHIGFELSEYHEEEQHSTVYDIPHSGHYFQIYYKDGSLLALSDSLDEYRFPLEHERVIEEGEYFETIMLNDKEPIRVISKLISIHDRYRKVDRYFIVQVAENLVSMYANLKNLKMLILYSIPFFILLSGLGGFVITMLSLRPLRDFSKEVGKISESSLHRRIETYTLSRELKGLAGAFNSMMEKLEKAFSQQKRFLADASHELRTPTSVVKSCSEVYLRKERDKEEYRRALEIILENSREMERIVEKMMRLSRMEQKRFATEHEKIELKIIADKAISMILPIAEKKHINVVSNTPPNNIFIKGDRSSLIEALVNIIENAIKYNSENGTVSTTISEKNNQAVIEVMDTGIGIPDKHIDRIFERFYRAGNYSDSGSERIHGAGLGLSIAKEVIEGHNGRIEIQSKTGEGSTFAIYLPAIA